MAPPGASGASKRREFFFAARLVFLYETNMGEARGTDENFSCSVCRVCAETFVGAGQCCSRACRILWAELEEFWTLHFILASARWAGAPTAEEYFRSRLIDAVRVRPHSEESLAEVLVEILEEVEVDL